MAYQQTIKIHFASAKAAISASVDGRCTAGEKNRSGKTKTWIAHVAKMTPNESREDVLERLYADQKVVRLKNSGGVGTNMGAFEVRGGGVYVDGALIDREFMESGDYWLQCYSVAQAIKVRGFILAASLD